MTYTAVPNAKGFSGEFIIPISSSDKVLPKALASKRGCKQNHQNHACDRNHRQIFKAM